jgi:hypothetical protein
MSDFDIMTKILKYNEGDTEEMLARLKVQKIEDLKLQVLSQNPQLLGVGIPGQEGGNQQELGAEAGGPSAMPSPEGGEEGAPPPELPESNEPPAEKENAAEPANIPEPDSEDVKKYDLEIQNYDSDSDKEDIDYSTGDE